MARPGTKELRLSRSQNPLMGEQHLHVPAFNSYSEAKETYFKRTSEEHRRRFAQHFTPEKIARLMCSWVCELKPERILDPAVGLGIFPGILREMLPTASITGVDIDPLIFEFASAQLRNSAVRLVNGDFLSEDCEDSFDAIVANPPYIRHHDFRHSSDLLTSISRRSGVKIPRTMNMYGLFVLEICRRLKVGGRAAIVIPTEWANSNFGAALKTFFSGNDLLNTLLYLSSESRPFETALTTACVLFIEKPAAARASPTVRCVYINSLDADLRLESVVRGKPADPDSAIVKNIPLQALMATDKWDHLLSHQDEINLDGTVPLKSIGTTRRGIATGANAFFHLNLETAIAVGIQRRNLLPCVGRAQDVRGLIFDNYDADRLIAERAPSHLVGIVGEPNEAELAYIEAGVSQGLPSRHLLAARKTWFRMEQRPPAPIWAAVQSRTGLRFVRNRAGALNLTTFHCIYPRDLREIYLDALTVCLNSTPVQKMLKREVRTYGGGLEKLQPDDLLKIRLPALNQAPDTVLSELASMLPAIDIAYRQATPIPREADEAVQELLKSTRTDIDSMQRQANLFDE